MDQTQILIKIDQWQTEIKLASYCFADFANLITNFFADGLILGYEESKNPCSLAIFESNETLKNPPKSLREFLTDRNFSICSVDCDRLRRKIVNLCVEYLIYSYGHHPRQYDKIKVAKECVKLFPDLRDRGTDEGYETLYDPRSRGGFIEWRLKTVNKSRLNEIKEFERCLQLKKGESLQTKESEEFSNNDSNFEEKVTNLKTLSPKSDLHKIIALTKETCFTRQKLIFENSDLDIRTEFPRFFDTPSLVQTEFAQLFPDNANGLYEWWSEFRKYLEKVLSRLLILSGKTATHFADWGKDINIFISIIRLLPSKGLKKFGGQKFDAESSISRFLVFKQPSISLPTFIKSVKEEYMLSKPFIIAEGLSRKQISKFYVIVDMTSLPPNENFLDAFDVFCKVFFIFNFEYDVLLKSFLKFFEFFVYKLSVKDYIPTARIREIHSRIVAEKEKFRS